MKKIFTLLTAAFMTVGVYAQEQVTITWALSSTDNIGAEVTGDGKSSITAADMTHGSNHEIKANKHWYGLDGIELTYKVASTTPPDNEDSYIQFPFTVKAGKQFTISKISFNAAKLATGGEFDMNVFVLDNNGTKRTIENAVLLLRGTESGKDDLVTSRIYDQNTLENTYTGFNPFTGTNSLTFNIYNPGGNGGKTTCYSTIVIEGEITDEGYVETRDDAPISWDKSEITLKVRDQFTAPTLVNDKNLAVTFSSSDENIATVTEDGKITLVEGATGTVLISAFYNGGDEGAVYKSTTASTTINVESNIVDAYAWSEYDKIEKIGLTNGFYPEKTSGTTPGGNKLIDDSYIKIETVYTANYSNYTAEYLGHTFNGALQLGRVKNAPSADVPTGTENSGSSPIVVTAKKDLQLVMFFRRQALEEKFEDVDDIANNVITRTHYISIEKPNDGKSVHAIDQSNPTEILPQTIIIGELIGDAKGHDDYLNCATIWTLEAGKTYTLYALSTTIACHGIGYMIEPEAPKAVIDGNDHDGSAIELSGKNKTIKLTAATEGHHLYYHFAPATETQEFDAPVPTAAAPAETLEHDGKTFTLVPETGILLTQAGTLSYLAHDPETGLKSAVSTINVTGEGDDISTGIANIADDAAAAPVEYFNLQGVRVANPENGLYIKRQGDKVEKVYVK